MPPLTEAKNEPAWDDRLDIPAARVWAADFGDGFSSAWRQCPKAEWLFYLGGTLNCDRKTMVLAANDCILYARKNPNMYATSDQADDKKNDDVFPDAGNMFAWMVLSSKQFDFVEQWNRGEASVDDCREAEAAAANDAATISPGACRHNLEADEASACQCMHNAIKHVFRAILVLEAMQNEDVESQIGAQKSSTEIGLVCDAFRKLSNQSSDEKRASRDALFIFNLGMAVKEASLVIDLKTEPSRLASIVRDRVTLPEGGLP